MPLPSSPEAAGSSSVEDALLQAAQEVLAPLARLMVAKGVTFGAVEERLKVAFVRAAIEAALAARPDALPHRLVSRVAAATGINRREVTRLVEAGTEPAVPRRSPALRVFARWTTDPAYRTTAGKPRVLPRQGPAPSFESLAASVTRDVHARSLLDDLLRLDLATWDTRRDTLSLKREAFVPRDDAVRLLGYLGANVGDHLSAAVENVVGTPGRHFEQAIIADGLGEASLAEVHQLIAPQWKQLIRALVPVIQARVDADGAEGAEPPGRLRIGLYMYDNGSAPQPQPGPQETDHD